MSQSSVPSFAELLAGARRSAVHLEMRDAYGVGDEAVEFEEFKRKNEVNLALDGGDNLTYIAPTMVNLRLAQERHPDVQFRQTREH